MKRGPWPGSAEAPVLGRYSLWPLFLFLEASQPQPATDRFFDRRNLIRRQLTQLADQLACGTVTRLWASKAPTCRNRVDTTTSNCEPRVLVVCPTNVARSGPADRAGRSGPGMGGPWRLSQIDQLDLTAPGGGHP